MCMHTHVHKWTHNLADSLLNYNLTSCLDICISTKSQPHRSRREYLHGKIPTRIKEKQNGKTVFSLNAPVSKYLDSEKTGVELTDSFMTVNVQKPEVWERAETVYCHLTIWPFCVFGGHIWDIYIPSKCNLLSGYHNRHNLHCVGCRRKKTSIW